MKKIYFLLLFSFCSTILFAQTRTGQNLNVTPNTKSISVTSSTAKTIGDTLMYFNGNGFYVNPTDQTAFDYLNEDMDGLVPHNAASGTTSKWMFWYSLDATEFQPNDVDTAFYISSTSWFDPAGTSDDWFEMGPITVPAATGLKLSWNIKNNPAYRDGYKIWASSTGMSNYTNFTGSPIYSRTDAYPSPTAATDSIWQTKTINIPASFNGGPVYIGFQHYAVDMDVLWLDEVTLIEAQVLGIENPDNITVSENFPNPVKNSTMFSYILTKNVNVNVNVFDMSGRLVISMPQGNQEAGTHRVTINAENLSNGTYFYTLTAGENKTTKKMVVVK
jgi:hypothetical protein